MANPFNFTVPAEIYDMGLSVYAFRLYAHLCRVYQETGRPVRTSARALAAHCGFSVGHISTAKQELRSFGLLQSERRVGLFGWAEELVPCEPGQGSTARLSLVGFIYLLEGGGYYKIGKSANPIERVKKLTTLPFPVRVIHTIRVTDMAWAEAYLHRTFAHCRLNGEWFGLTPDEVGWICALTELEPA